MTCEKSWVVKRSGAVWPLRGRKRGEELIGRYYPYLQKAGLVYLFRLGKWHQAGELVKARTFVVPEVWKVFCGFDLAVLINKCLYEGTDEDGKQALVDYSLSNIAFCRKNGVYRWRLKNLILWSTARSLSAAASA